MSLPSGKSSWLFAGREPTAPWWRVIQWWELLRIPYNLIVGFCGALSLLMLCWAVENSGKLRPGEDVVEPLAWMAVGFMANVCYTLGWVVELYYKLSYSVLPPRFGPWLFKLGLGFSVFVVSLPGLFAAGELLLRWLHVLQ